MHLQQHGFVLVPDFLSLRELNAARQNMLRYVPTAEELAATPEFDKQMETEVRRMMVPELQSLIRHDPTPVLKGLKCPVLALGGTLDTQVPAKQNLPAIAAGLAQGLTEDYAVVSLPKLNHLFQTARTGAAKEFANIEETIAPVALETIATWLTRVTLSPAR